jgi:hypothetical protein
MAQKTKPMKIDTPAINPSMPINIWGVDEQCGRKNR